MYERLNMLRGVNLGGWLSQCDYSAARLMQFITEEDFRQIAGWGLDHVRIPVDCDILQSPDGTLLEAGFERLDFAFAMCGKYGLKAVLDLHKAHGFAWDNAEKRTRTELFSQEKYQRLFLNLWEALAQRYGSLADRVVFELLNEVTEDAFMPAWNALAAEAVRRIRRAAPGSFILVGASSYNAARCVPLLAAPGDDRVIYNFHCYEPMAFTHQGAHWVDALDKSVRVSFEESGVTEAFFEQVFAPAVRAAQERGTTLYCGEYGVIDVAKPQDALQWLQCISRVFKRHGIAHALWNYKEMDFGLTAPALDAVRAAMLEAM